MPDDRTETRAPAWPAATLLGQLTDPTRSALLSLGTAVAFPPGAHLIHIGAREDHGFLLTQGSVKVRGNDGVREPLLDVRVAGDLIGEMAMLTGAARSATVVASSTVSTRRIAGIELRDFMYAQPGVAVEIAKVVTNRLRWANDRRTDFGTALPICRVSRLLLALNDIYVNITTTDAIPLTQAEVASLASVSLASAENTLRKLQRQGAVRLGYRKITIINRGILIAAA